MYHFFWQNFHLLLLATILITFLVDYLNENKRAIQSHLTSFYLIPLVVGLAAIYQGWELYKYQGFQFSQDGNMAAGALLFGGFLMLSYYLYSYFSFPRNTKKRKHL